MKFDLSTALIIAVLILVVIVFFSKGESFTIEERVDILEQRVNALYSGGAGLRGQAIYSGTNQ